MIVYFTKRNKPICFYRSFEHFRWKPKESSTHSILSRICAHCTAHCTGAVNYYSVAYPCSSELWQTSVKEEVSHIFLEIHQPRLGAT